MKNIRTILTAAALTLAGGLAFASGTSEPDAVRVRSGSIARFGDGGRQPGHVDLPGAFGPEGKLFAIVTEGGTLAVGECATGRVKFKLGRLARGDAAAFSPDGKRLIACFANGSVRMFDARTGRALCALRTQTYKYTSATFSPDSKYLAAAITERGIEVRETVTGTVRFYVPAKDHGGIVAVFSPDGSMLATVGRDGALNVWELATGRRLMHTIGFRRGVFSPDGKYILALGEKRTAHLFELPSGRRRLKVVDPTKALTSAEFSSDSKTLVTVSKDGILRLWDTVSGRVRQQVKVSRDGHLAVDMAPQSGVTAPWQADDSVLVGDLVIAH